MTIWGIYKWGDCRVSTPIIFDKIIKQTNKQKSGIGFCTSGNKGCHILLEIWLSYSYSFFKLNDCKSQQTKLKTFQNSSKFITINFVVVCDLYGDCIS